MPYRTSNRGHKGRPKLAGSPDPRHGLSSVAEPSQPFTDCPRTERLGGGREGSTVNQAPALMTASVGAPHFNERTA